MTEIVFPAMEETSKETQKQMIKRFNATILHDEFPDEAWVRTLDPIKGNKLSPRYEGPYTVVGRTAHGTYELRDRTGQMLHRNHAPSQLKLLLDDFDETETYEVKEISDHKPDQHDPGTHSLPCQMKKLSRPKMGHMGT